VRVGAPAVGCSEHPLRVCAPCHATLRSELEFGLRDQASLPLLCEAHAVTCTATLQCLACAGALHVLNDACDPFARPHGALHPARAGEVPCGAALCPACAARPHDCEEVHACAEGW